MYVPHSFSVKDNNEIIAFMKQYSFATIITAQNNSPIATHLPFSIGEKGDSLILSSHFAKANEQADTLIDNTVLVIFNEPHAYISPRHYDKELSVPTWNYIAVHVYGKARIITDIDEGFKLLEQMIDTYEKEYKTQWANLPESFKLNMLGGIVPFEITVTSIQAQKKLSQNKNENERKRIIDELSGSKYETERQIAYFMNKDIKPSGNSNLS